MADPRASAGDASGGDRPIALSAGDPAGIGLDITLAAWVDRGRHKLPEFVLYGDATALSQRAQALGIGVQVAVVDDLRQVRTTFSTAIPVVQVPLPHPVIAGQPDSRNGAAVIATIERATAAVATGKARALVTNPIAKSVLYDAGFSYPGHTEFLADLAARHIPHPDVGGVYTSIMMLACDELRVVPLTIHVALETVPAAITQASIAIALRVMHRALIDDFGIAAPRIAVAGLNPHAGESGSMGLQDRDVIAPAIAALRAEGLTLTGPHPADTLFHGAARARYDAVLCMYHDQALIPIKTLAFDRGVNVTLGLPFVRTSPDHGTAFDIAGKGVASPTSLIEALKLADALGRRRSDRAVATHVGEARA